MRLQKQDLLEVPKLEIAQRTTTSTCLVTKSDLILALSSFRPRGFSLPKVVITALAILETGGIYVPCDERLPWGRVANMVSLAAVKVLVAGRRSRRSGRKCLLFHQFHPSCFRFVGDGEVKMESWSFHPGSWL